MTASEVAGSDWSSTELDLIAADYFVVREQRLSA